MHGGSSFRLVKRKHTAVSMLLAVIATLIAGAAGKGWCETALDLNLPAAKASQCGAGNLFTFENHNAYPIWLGEFVGDPTKVVVPSSGWKVDAASSVSLCTTPPFKSGRFWARTECDFEDLYQSGTLDPMTEKRAVPFSTCNADTDCPTNPDGSSYDCVGGICMVDCTTHSSSALFCQGEMGEAVNTQAVCLKNPGGATFDVCGYTGGVCKTGDCGGLLQCEGTWTNGGVQTTISDTGSAPASLFEPTSTSATEVNYDVSNVSGYNDLIRVKVSPQPNAEKDYPNNCYEPKCVSDLNESCPLNLQVTEAPTTTKTAIKCGNHTGLYCSSGQCDDCVAGSGQSCDALSQKTCVIGCNDPGDQCASNMEAPNLSCDTAIPNPANGGWTSDGSTYFDMYEAANKNGTAKNNPNFGTAMSSQNQGNPLCWSDPTFANANIDCAPDQVCDTTDATTLGFPSGIGLCVYSKGQTPTGDTGGLAPQIRCGAAADPGGVGDSCGGYYTIPNGNPTVNPPLYPDALGYTCNQVTITAGGHKSDATLACLPPFGSSLVVGLGDPVTPMTVAPPSEPLYTGSGSELNPEWLAAAQWSTGNGTTAGKPFYQYFSKACPYAYAWTYDDNAGGFSCNSSVSNGNSQNVNFTITFGPLAQPKPPTATATPTATASPTATPTPFATPTATSTATTTATATKTATPTPTATATSTNMPTATATSTAMVTATATATSTPTQTPTLTPSPTGSATPGCAPDFLYLSTNPAGTLAFGDVAPKGTAAASLMVTSNESAGTLTLSTKFSTGNVSDFSVTGGTCVANKVLGAGQSCSYALQLKAGTKGGAVRTNFTITGAFAPHVCPAGDHQVITVNLAGDITSP